MEYYRQFPAAILRLRVRSIVLLTRPPLTLAGAYDLHALATPPAFNLSQDQTLQLKSVDPRRCRRGVLQWKVCLFYPSRAPTCPSRPRMRAMRIKTDERAGGPTGHSLVERDPPLPA